MKIHHWGLVLLAMFVALAFGQDYIVWSGGVSEQKRESAPADTIKLTFFHAGPDSSPPYPQVRNWKGIEFVDIGTRGRWLALALPDGDQAIPGKRAIRGSETTRVEVDNEQKP